MKKNKINPLTIQCKRTIALGLMLFIAISADARTLIFQSGSSEASSSPSAVSGSASPQVPANNALPSAGVSNTASHSATLPSSANSELFFMLEQLQQEVNTLRGIIEEQGHELRMLKQSSRDRYVDIDSRVLDLTKRVTDLSGHSTQIPQSQAPQGAAPLEKTGNTQAPSESLRKPVASSPAKAVAAVREPTKAENAAYNDAYALIKDKKFDDAILALFSYTENFPDSPLLPNVYYWLGEVYLASSKFEQAKTSFSLVLTAYPDSPKTSDALYKLALTLDRLGQKEQARKYLAEVRQRFPDSTAAKLAEDYTLNP